MTSRYRHRRTFDPAIAFPSPVEPGEIIVNTSNRQIAVGDASAGQLGVPKALIGVRFFDTTARYALNDVVVQAGNLYKANATIPPGAFNGANWTQLGVVTTMPAGSVVFTPTGNVIAIDVQSAIAEVDAEKVAKAGDVMSGHLSLPTSPSAPNAVRKDYVDTADAALATLAGSKVDKGGDTMSGLLTLSGDPSAPLHAVTKQYLDANTGSALTVSDTPPAGAKDGSLWWESDSGLLYVRYNDGNTIQWVIAAPQPDINAFASKQYVDAADGTKVAKTGDSMTGNLTFSFANPSITINKPASGQPNTIYGAVAGVPRWTVLPGDATAEGGSNAGSNFAISRYSDAGALLDSPLVINRATGAAAFGAGVTVPLSGGSFAIAGANASFTSSATQTVVAFDTTSSLAYNKGSTYQLYAASVVICTFTPPGHLTIPGQGYKPGGGAWADSSDARIKTVEGEYTTGLDAVAQLRPVTYTFKGNDTPEPPAHIKVPGDTSETQSDEPLTVPYPNSPHWQVALDQKTFHGLIAQEVEAIFPEMVTQRSGYIDGAAVTDVRDLDTGPLIFALINAIKELKARVEVLEGV